MGQKIFFFNDIIAILLKVLISKIGYESTVFRSGSELETGIQ